MANSYVSKINGHFLKDTEARQSITELNQEIDGIPEDLLQAQNDIRKLNTDLDNVKEHALIYEQIVDELSAKVDNGSGGGTGAGASGGLSIKKIEFTDRPSEWAWLVNNYNKVIRSELLTALSPVPTIFNDVTALYGATNLKGVLFSSVVPRLVNTEKVNVDILRIVVYENNSVGVLGATNLDLTTTPAIGISGQTDTTIPDEAWAGYSVKHTIYYID